jgi:hypothetical protein
MNVDGAHNLNGKVNQTKATGCLNSVENCMEVHLDSLWSRGTRHASRSRGALPTGCSRITFGSLQPIGAVCTWSTTHLSIRIPRTPNEHAKSTSVRLGAAFVSTDLMRASGTHRRRQDLPPCPADPPRLRYPGDRVARMPLGAPVRQFRPRCRLHL